MFLIRRQQYWQWQGLDSEGQQQKGVIAASNRQQAHAYLHHHAIVILTLRRFWVLSTPHCSAAVLTEWLSHLQQLLAAGIPVSQSLHVLLQIPDNHARLLLTQNLRDALSLGHSLSESLRLTPYAYLSPVEHSLLNTAEQDSALPEGLLQLTKQRQHRQQWLRHCRQQLRYPLTLLGLGIACVILMMNMIVPRFALLYQQSGHPLPLLTQQLIQANRLLTASPLPYIVLAAMAWSGWHWRHHPRVQNIIARLPIIASLRRHQLGLALIERLKFSRHIPAASPHQHPQDSVEFLSQQIQHALEAGSSLSHVLCSCRSGSRPLFAKDIIYLIRIAEQTGRMDEVLKQTSQLLEQRSEHYHRTLAAWLEPLLLASLGLVIGALMLSLYLPILDMKDVMI